VAPARVRLRYHRTVTLARRRLLPILLALLSAGLVTSAQRGGRFFRSATAGHRNPPYDGRFTFTRVRFTGGSAWNHDYPDADRNLPLILDAVTAIHPRLDGTTRVEAAVYLPRKTFRAQAEAPDVPTALDRLVQRLERQIRDHHGKRKKRKTRPDGLDSAPPAPDTVETPEELA